MNKITEKALNNIIMKMDQLLDELEKNKELTTEEKAEIGCVYRNVFNFIKREDYDHNIGVLNNDRLKNQFKLREL